MALIERLQADALALEHGAAGPGGVVNHRRPVYRRARSHWHLHRRVPGSHGRWRRRSRRAGVARRNRLAGSSAVEQAARPSTEPRRDPRRPSRPRHGVMRPGRGAVLDSPAAAAVHTSGASRDHVQRPRPLVLRRPVPGEPGARLPRSGTTSTMMNGRTSLRRARQPASRSWTAGRRRSRPCPRPSWAPTSRWTARSSSASWPPSNSPRRSSARRPGTRCPRSTCWDPGSTRSWPASSPRWACASPPPPGGSRGSWPRR